MLNIFAKSVLKFFLNNFFLHSDERWLWIGLNKRSPDLQGSWEWSDHTPVSLNFLVWDNIKGLFVSISGKLIVK